MSHFTVLVIGEDVEKQLQPYHEFECTGTNDEYVLDVSEYDQALEEYNNDKTIRLKDPDGNLHYPYDDKFYRDPTVEEKKIMGPIPGIGCEKRISWYSKDWSDGRGYRPKVRFIPEGYEEVNEPVNKTQSFLNYVKYSYTETTVDHNEAINKDGEHKYGYVVVNDNNEAVDVIKRTNPNKKWDWWEIGGRWTGFFKLKDIKSEHRVGSPGLMTPVAKPGYTDQVRKKDIDFEGIKKEAKKKAEEKWNKVMNVVGNMDDFTPWDVMRDEIYKGDIKSAREAYHKQKQPKLIKNDKDLFFTDLEDFMCSKEEYIQNAENEALVTFALVKDGEWYERGEMGWWGIVLNETDKKEWNRKFNELLDSLPEDTLLTVVDCHI